MKAKRTSLKGKAPTYAPAAAVAALVALLVAMLLVPAWGAPDRTRIPVQAKARSVSARCATRAPRAQRLDSSLDQLARTNSGKGLAAARAFAKRRMLKVKDGSVQVVVEAAGAKDGAVRAVVLSGGTTLRRYKNLILADVPIGKLAALSRAKGVLAVRPPATPYAQTVTSQGVAEMNADDWQGAGMDGSGVKVGIIDLGFTWYDLVLGTELPATVTTWGGSSAGGESTGTPHGTGVAETVHDVAPGASLYLARVGNEVELGSAKDWMKAQGVTVINHSVAWFGTEGGNGTGPINSVINDAVGNGIFWANAAGNYRNRHWMGDFTDRTGNDWINWDNTTWEYNTFKATQGNTIVGRLTWEDSWTAASQDYDLVLAQWTGGRWVDIATSTNAQDGTAGCKPHESIGYIAPATGTYGWCLERVDATRTAVDFDLLTPNQDLDNPSNTSGHFFDHARSISVPADNPSNGFMSVAAIGRSTGFAQESYSSEGPTRDGRTAPEIAGPSRTDNWTYGTFTGTSASSPHIAGIAALWKGMNPAHTPADIEDYIDRHAVDLGTAGVDNLYGHGRVELPAPSDGSLLGEAVDNTALSWVTGGNGNWFYQSAVSGHGGDAAQAGDIGGNDMTYMGTTVTGPGTLSFLWKVSSESDDHLRFFIDGGMVQQISGQVGWAPMTLAIPPGPHTIRWDYLKDWFWDGGQDTGWVDRVEYNHFPTLAWTGETSYTADGVDPELGIAVPPYVYTPFAYRVKYTDLDGDAPAFVLVHVKKGGVEVAGSPFVMTKVSGDYATGAVFGREVRTLPAGFDYTYYFEARDPLGAPATGPPNSALDAPDVTNPPTLSWTGEANYTTDGLNPEAGGNSTTFTYRVKYTDLDGDAPTYVRVHIYKGGVETSGSPFAMTQVPGGAYATGAIYGYTRTLTSGTDYTYRFEAQDSRGFSAFGWPLEDSPTDLVDAPDVMNAPTLSWTGEAGYATDGLNPETGDNSTTFTYRVKYTDLDGDAPAFMHVRVYKGGGEIAGSPFDMSQISTDYASGAIYSYSRTLTSGTDYTYKFEAQDSLGAPVTGAPTGLIDAPDVTNAPTLSWTGEANYTADGVDPETGDESTNFTYRVKYTDLDGDAPDWVLLHIYDSGLEIDGSPIKMDEISNTYATGAIFSHTRTLALSRDYTYGFEAQDSRGAHADGTPTELVDAPDVTNAPTLSWTGETNYATDGLDPETGDNLTRLTYRVKYRDVFDRAPTYVGVRIYKGGEEIAGSPFRMKLASGHFEKGAIFNYRRTLTSGTDYTYKFEARDWHDDPVGGPPTGLIDAPDITNAPTLSWTGETEYTTDGIDPEIGGDSTRFSYHVTYTDLDGDAPNNMLIHIYDGGVEIAGSPFRMDEISGSYATGAIFTYDTALPLGTNYTYRFEAEDSRGVAATGPPTDPIDAPDVIDAPALSWTGEANYTADGTDPETGDSSTNFSYRVRYADLHGDPPEYVCVHISRGVKPIDGSPFRMEMVSGSPDRGAVFGYTRALPAAADYEYRFEARDSRGLVVAGPPAAEPVKGPIVENRPPALSNGRVTSSVGMMSTVFHYYVDYLDPDGDPPASCAVVIDGVRHAMSPDRGAGFGAYLAGVGAYRVAGATYCYETSGTALGVGNHSYHFEFDDGVGGSTRAPSVGESAGPFVDGVAPTTTAMAPIYSTDVATNRVFPVAWVAADAALSSGIRSFDAQYKTGLSGSWANWKLDTTATTVSFAGTPGSTYYLRARAEDIGGNVGAWSRTVSTIVPYDQPPVGYRGAWRRASSASLYRGSSRYSSARGASVARSYLRARRLTLIVTKRSTGGIAYVYIGRTRVKIISLYSSRTAYRARVLIRAYSVPKSVALKIVVVRRKVRASRGYRVEIDGVAIGR